MVRIVRVAGTAVVVATVVTCGVLFGAASPVFAHNSFTGSTPKDGAVLNTAPTEVRLKFLAKLDPKTTKITVGDPAGASAASGAATFDGSTVVVPLRATTAGSYVVGYEIASSDGHPIKGRFTFTLTPAAVPAPSPTPVAPSPSAAAVVTVAAPAGAVGVPASDSRGTLWWPWVLAAGLASVVALTVARRRRA